MVRTGARGLAVLVMALATLAAVPPLAAQPAAGSGAAWEAPAAPPGIIAGDAGPAWPLYDLDRIREQLARPRTLALALPDDLPTFHVQIDEEMPGIETWLGDLSELAAGPPVGPAFHQQYLAMTTPPNARAAFTNGELLQVLATSLAGHYAMRGITDFFTGLVSEARSARACNEVRGTLVDLNQVRARAGLVPVPVPEC
jgi:hypothetical protein